MRWAAHNVRRHSTGVKRLHHPVVGDLDLPKPQPAGKVYLVEWLWPRGVRRDALVLDGWCKDSAPSTELRQWFSHDPAKWNEFRRRYTVELDHSPEGWRPLAEAAAAGDVTLLYSSRDRDHNNAVVLRDYLLTHRKG